MSAQRKDEATASLGSGLERVLVTGAAGFVGYHTVRALLASDVSEVVGIDCFLDNYDPLRKRQNVRDLSDLEGFHFIGADVRNVDLEWLLEGVDGVVHLAALPGVRASWAEQFHLYAEHNIQATHRLLEACRDRPIASFVYASSSSVYGNAPVFPTPVDTVTSPFSPYGVTKLAAEQLCTLYGANHGVPVISLRYFTVYGPRQRPDMAIQRLIEAALTDQTFPLYGSGKQVRDFTYVEDAARANVAALTSGAPPGTVLNVAGGSSSTMREVIGKVEELTGRSIRIDQFGSQSGDVERTGGDISESLEVMNWRPNVQLADGLRDQIEWMRVAQTTDRPEQSADISDGTLDELLGRPT